MSWTRYHSKSEIERRRQKSIEAYEALEREENVMELIFDDQTEELCDRVMIALKKAFDEVIDKALMEMMPGFLEDARKRRARR